MTDREFYRRLGMKLRRARAVRQLTQHEVAAAINVTYQQIGKYERGEVQLSASRVLQLADALDLQVRDLFPPRAA